VSLPPAGLDEERPGEPGRWPSRLTVTPVGGRRRDADHPGPGRCFCITRPKPGERRLGARRCRPAAPGGGELCDRPLFAGNAAGQCELRRRVPTPIFAPAVPMEKRGTPPARDLPTAALANVPDGGGGRPL